MLSNNTVSNNVADHLGGGVKHYAGVYFDHSDDATLIGNTISGNRSANRCGGVCFSDSDNVTLERNTVISNSAGSPGFVVSEGGGLYFASSANADLSGNTISQNSTNTFGGGIYVAVSTISLTGNRINSNQSTQGAGLYLTGGDATLDRNLITGNVSSSYPAYGLDGDGGGLCLNNAEATLTSNVIIDNQVEVEGSGLYITGSSADLLHTTIARNSGGDDSGVHIAGIASIVSLTNTIVATHQVGIFAAAGNTANINGVLWYNNDTGYGGGGTFSVTNEYTGDPAFKRDGYHLTRSSAAIDRGVDGGVTMDIDGFGRPCGLAPDLGADEMPCLFLPVILRNWGG
jgi:parallel beta-helix repeat protein